VITYREVFRRGEFRTLFASTALSVSAGTMTMLALSALVYARTGSPLLAAVAYLGGFLPQALGALTLMSLADRLPPRATLVGWRLASVALLTVLALGGLPIWGMLALIMLAGLGDAVVSAVGSATVVDVLDGGAYVLGKSVLNVCVGAMQIVGYAAGGALLALVGPYRTFGVAAGVGLVTATITRLGLRRRPPRATGRASVGATWQGNRVLFGHPGTRRLLLAQWLPNGLIVGAEAMFVPYAGNAGGALFAAAAGGMLLGDLVVGRWTSPALRARLGLPLYALLAVPYLAFALRPGVGIATALIAVASFGYGATLTIQERFLTVVPDELLGQALGLAGSGMMTMQAVAATAVGALAELTAPALAMTIAAVASLVTTVALLARPVPARRPEPAPSVP
jgi:hypothetical protein